jgi:hypothetical protein
MSPHPGNPTVGSENKSNQSKPINPNCWICLLAFTPYSPDTWQATVMKKKKKKKNKTNKQQQQIK